MINIILPNEGLCNRLYRIRECAILQKVLDNKPITIWWPMSEGSWNIDCNKIFYSLNPDIKLKSFKAAKDGSLPFVGNESVMRKPFNISKKVKKNYGGQAASDLFKIIWPQEEILLNAKQFYKNNMNGQCSLGIHARNFIYKDKIGARNVNWYKERLQEKKTYFVSTDSPTFYKRIQELHDSSKFIRFVGVNFKYFIEYTEWFNKFRAEHCPAYDNEDPFDCEKIAFLYSREVPDKFSSGNPDRIKEAFVDLLLLASCNSFVQTPDSSFSRLAQDINLGLNPIFNDKPRT
jgi:hypothetical protein